MFELNSKFKSKVLMSSRDYKEKGRNTVDLVSTLSTLDTKNIIVKPIVFSSCKYPSCNKVPNYFLNTFCEEHSFLFFKYKIPIETVYQDKILMIKGTPTIMYNKRSDTVLIKKQTILTFKFYTCSLNNNLYSLYSSDYGDSICCKDYEFHKSKFFQVNFFSFFDYYKLDNFTMQRLNENVKSISFNRPESNCINCINFQNDCFEDNSGKIFSNFYRCSIHTLRFDFKDQNIELYNLNIPYLSDLNFCIVCCFSKPNVSCRYCGGNIKREVYSFEIKSNNRLKYLVDNLKYSIDDKNLYLKNISKDKETIAKELAILLSNQYYTITLDKLIEEDINLSTVDEVVRTINSITDKYCVDFIFTDPEMKLCRSLKNEFSNDLVVFVLDPIDSESLLNIDCNLYVYTENSPDETDIFIYNTDYICKRCLKKMSYKADYCTLCENLTLNYRRIENITSNCNDNIVDSGTENNIDDFSNEHNKEKEVRTDQQAYFDVNNLLEEKFKTKNPFDILKDCSEDLKPLEYNNFEEIQQTDVSKTDAEFKIFCSKLINQLNSMTLVKKMSKGDGYCAFRSLIGSISEYKLFNINEMKDILRKLSKLSGTHDWFTALSLYEVALEYGFNLIIIHENLEKYARFNISDEMKSLPKIIITSDFDGDSGTHFNFITRNYAYQDNMDVNYINNDYQVTFTKDWAESDHESSVISVEDESVKKENDNHHLAEDENELETSEEKSKEESEEESDFEGEDYEEIEYDDLENEEVLETPKCCEVPSIVLKNNYGHFSELLNQFKNKHPSYDCLFNMILLSNKYLSNLHNMTNIPIEAITFLKNFLKFRHNTFAYIFTNEIIKQYEDFDSEAPFKYIDSNRTPDLIIYKENTKNVIIYEFTVVMNSLRANFLKGIDAKTSKYRNEIILFENLGWQVIYKPVFYSLTNTIDENIKIWVENYFDCESPSITQLLENFIEHLDFTYNYLFTMSFEDNFDRDFANASKFVEDKNIYEDNWSVQIVKADKTLVYEFIDYLKRTDFNENDKYTIRRGGRRFHIRLSTRVDQTDAMTGFYLNELKKDELRLYKKFSHLLNGKDKVQLYTRYSLEDLNEFKPTHGVRIETKKFDDSFTKKNKKNFSVYTMEQSLKINEILDNNSMNELNHEFSYDDLKESLEIYDSKMSQFLTPNNHSTPPINDKPRRSFLAFINTESTTNIKFSEGLKIKSFSIMDMKSNFAKVAYSMKNRITYTETNEMFDPKVQENYKIAMSNFYNALHNIDNGRLKNIKLKKAIKLSGQEDKLNSLYLTMKQEQLKYMRMSDKISKPGTLNIDKTLQNTLKKEFNWTSNRGYNLYMGEEKSLIQLFEVLKSPSLKISRDFVIPEDNFDSKFFNKLKDESKTFLKRHLNEIITTSLYQNLDFLSRLAYTLLALSNKTFNHKKIALDNLGLTNVMLIVKGGRKLTTTRKTKIFKLIYPAANELQNWNPDLVFSEDSAIDETPWMQLSQNVLLDLMSGPYKLLSNYTYLRDKVDPDTAFEILAMPTALMMHNRRKTEIMLHNMRYLIVNPIGFLSQVNKMLPEFAGPCYSAFDHSIRLGIKRHYLNYVDKIRSWSELGSNDSETFKRSAICHPYMKRCLKNIDDLTYVIYSTYMMSKGHYEQSLEQTINLKNIMETHDDYMTSEHNHTVDLTTTEGIEIVKKDDFSYSPHVAYNVGKFLSAELKNKNAANHLTVGWNRIMSTSIDEMANNRGLRWDGKEFFGHKGYFVVYKKLFEENFKCLEEILLLEDEKKIHKELRKVNETFYTQQNKINLDEVVFHVVDKSQRGGHREIYVMDYTTKLYQNPIEKMFKLICEFIDNEIISVPSAKRANLIHKKCFEYRSDKYDTYYMTFDCRKWAPRSNVDKYLYMLLGMQDVLPNDMLLSVIEYFSKHTKKQVHTRKEVLEKFLSNPDNNEKYSKYFNIDENKQSGWFEMPYSFVMGIFNMLSSLMHAGGQIYFKYLLEKEYLKNLYRVDIDMYAHSDDSGGRLSLDCKIDDSKLECKKIIGKYEFMQKTLNHLMSTKKCNVSNVYFELLSILYINHQLLPLLPKFLGNIALSFTGSGISSDFKQIISKSIELQSNGATGSQAYRVQLILSNMYRNFYRVVNQSSLPALGGFVNSWPTLYLIYGSAVDEVRMSHFNNDFYSRLMTFATEKLDYEVVDGTLNLKYSNVLRMPRAYHQFKKCIKLPEFEDSEWFFEQNKTRHSLLNLYWFRSKLESSNFALSILNINDIRRCYDSLYMASKRHIIGKYDSYSINDIYLNILETVPEYTGHEKLLHVMYKKLFDFYVWSDFLKEPTFSRKMELTTKPCSISLTNFVESPIVEYNSLNLATQMHRPELMKYTYSNKMYGIEINSMKNYLNNLGVDTDIKTRKRFLDYMSKTRNSVNYFYGKLKNESRALNNNSGLYQLIIENYHENIKLNPSTSKYIEDTRRLIDVNDKIKKLILTSYFYSIYKRTRDEMLATIPVNKNITGGKDVFVNNIPDMINEQIDHPGLIPYLNLIQQTEPVPINLSNITNWCIWIEKQSRIGKEWVGKGKLHISLDGTIFEMTIINKEITKIRHKMKEPRLFTDLTTQYFTNILQIFDLNFALPITPEEGKLFFGLDKESRLGFFSGNNVNFGIQNCVNDGSFDNTGYMIPKIWDYNNGKHYVTINKNNYRLNTLDEIVFSKSKINIFDVIDWDSIDNTVKNNFMRSMFSGDYGSIDIVEYDREELIEKFLATDLYNLWYSSMKQSKSLATSFWDDILSNITYSEESFPVMFETMGMAEVERILPKNKKDNMALYLFYDNDNPDVFTVRNKLNNLSTDDEKRKYLIQIVLSLKQESGLLTLPEIGDPENFKLYIYNKLPEHTWFNITNIMSEAIYSGYLSLSHKSKIDFHKIFEQTIKNSLDIYLLFTYDALRYDENSPRPDDYIALTFDQIILHQLLELIFSEKSAFSDFARTFRGTQMKNVPRHPKYEQDWHYILANIFKFYNCFNISDQNKQMMNAAAVRLVRIEKQKSQSKFSEIEYTKVEKIFDYPVKPPLMQIFTKTYDISKETITYKDCSFAGLTKFDFLASNLNINKDLFGEFLDDTMELDASMARKLRSDKLIFFDQLKDFINYQNSSKSNNNRCYVLKYYEPNLNPKWLKVKDNKGDYKIMFAYNYEYNTKIKGIMPSKRKVEKMFKKYKNYYEEKKSVDWFESLTNKNKKEVKINLEDKPTIDFIIKQHDIDKHESYNEDLIKYLNKLYNLDEDTTIKITELFKTNKTPITKFLQLKRIIKEFERTEAQDNNLEKMLKSILNKQNFQGDFNIKTNFKRSLAATEKEPTKLISKTTSYKKEFKQAERIFMDKYGKVLTGNIKLTKATKGYLSTSIKMLINSLNRNKLTHHAGLCRVMLDVLTTAEEGNTNSESYEFEELYKEMITFLNEKILETEESFDTIDPPQAKIEDWKLNPKRNS